MIAATGAGVGDADPGAKQDDAAQVSQKGPGESLKHPALHVLSVSTAAERQAVSDCRSRVIYGADRNNLLPPLGLDRYIGLDTEQDSSFEFVLMGVPLSGIAPKRRIPFILTTPSESPDKKTCLNPEWFVGFDLDERGNTCSRASWFPAPLTQSKCEFCPGNFFEGSCAQSWVVPLAGPTGRCRPCNASRTDVKEKQS
jgi:hypothetical protein